MVHNTGLRPGLVQTVSRNQRRRARKVAMDWRKRVRGLVQSSSLAILEVSVIALDVVMLNADDLTLQTLDRLPGRQYRPYSAI